VETAKPFDPRKSQSPVTYPFAISHDQRSPVFTANRAAPTQQLDEVAKAHQTVPAVIALAWLIQRKSVTAPIASATSAKQLSELVKSAEIRLSAEQVNRLEAASAK
jgi:aryl-alcohol dehydrogenase-like predicted oxidoreductase